MKLEQSFEVQAPIDDVWAALTDLERVAPCLPGAAITGRDDDGGWRGEFKVKLGPTTASYRGTVSFEEIDEAGHRAVMKAKGWGRIISMCSLNGVNAHIGSVEYNAAKEALRTLTRTAAREWAATGIVANVIVTLIVRQLGYSNQSGGIAWIPLILGAIVAAILIVVYGRISHKQVNA